MVKEINAVGYLFSLVGLVLSAHERQHLDGEEPFLISLNINAELGFQSSIWNPDLLVPTGLLICTTLYTLCNGR